MNLGLDMFGLLDVLRYAFSCTDGSGALHSREFHLSITRYLCCSDFRGNENSWILTLMILCMFREGLQSAKKTFNIQLPFWKEEPKRTPTEQKLKMSHLHPFLAGAAVTSRDDWFMFGIFSEYQHYLQDVWCFSDIGKSNIQALRWD